MDKSWRIVKNEDGSVLVIMDNAKCILVRNDGITGFAFVDAYLNMMSRNYQNHLIAADLILQRQVGERYGNIRRIPKVHRSYLAIVSMSCAFASDSSEPAYTEGRGFHFQRSECALRSICPFNGYHPSNKGKKLVCCNPIHELSLTPTQLSLANYLVNTSFDLKDIAETMNLSESRVRSLASLVYSLLEAENRQELVMLLKNKRIL